MYTLPKVVRWKISIITTIAPIYFEPTSFEKRETITELEFYFLYFCQLIQ